ncbi:hypothetical protein, partial [Streptomyces blattellae]|uniref:hypothetical protein n=1 Tax=Streptomyces blattellae TaxID=2569855 RepID=UPI001E39446E
ERSVEQACSFRGMKSGEPGGGDGVPLEGAAHDYRLAFALAAINTQQEMPKGVALLRGLVELGC